MAVSCQCRPVQVLLPVPRATPSGEGTHLCRSQAPRAAESPAKTSATHVSSWLQRSNELALCLDLERKTPHWDRSSSTTCCIQAGDGVQSYEQVVPRNRRCGNGNSPLPQGFVRVRVPVSQLQRSSHSRAHCRPRMPHAACRTLRRSQSKLGRRWPTEADVRGQEVLLRFGGCRAARPLLVFA